ncbi:M10 family metallopeptidase C-terminal domain-containing protein [Methylovulum psychrotolerans]|uniref:Calcium-binding protein n=1 Tax=Methylovulum psychrotolerans TaxID=1704499 RepID=A0A2S5CN22_9GAMM|nr:hypothetical protein [Methylovulum psychrotolerans]POZ52178.1 calcium-binding protein [Methylovulum psychrotolerans]
MAKRTGTNYSETLTGTDQSDTFNGKGGNDTLIGGLGNDFYDFSGNFGYDYVKESTNGGNDTLRILSDIPASAVRLVGDMYGDLSVIADGYGKITLPDHLLSTTVEFLKIGSAAPISLTGGLTMTGSDYGYESIYGTRYNDTINSKGGPDTLRGGLGQDCFVFEGNFGSDTISDFSKTQNDILDFSRIDANSSIAGDQSFSFIGTSAFTTAGGQIRYVNSNISNTTYVQLNTDNDVAAEYQVELVGKIGLTATDILG